MTDIDTEQRPMTRRELVTQGLDAVDKHRAGAIKIGRNIIQYGDIVQVMEVSKMMAVSGTAVPPFLRANPGACFAVALQAIEWEMSPFQVAGKAYEVNDRIAYESQLIHAVIESRAPLAKRLECSYSGSGTTRRCRVIGTFTDGEVRDYESPELAKVKKKSPLWVDDPDQQLWYYASRAWCRKWAPDVLMNIYSPDELRENPTLGRPEEEPDNLRDRVRLAHKPEGSGNGSVDTELSQIAPDGSRTIEHEEEPEKPAKRRRTVIRKPRAAKATDAAPQPEPSEEAPPVTEEPSGDPRPEPPPAEPEERMEPEHAPEPEPEAPQPPKTKAEYIEYAMEWINEATTDEEMRTRWNGERAMRNQLGMLEEDRKPLLQAMSNMTAFFEKQASDQ